MEIINYSSLYKEDNMFCWFPFQNVTLEQFSLFPLFFIKNNQQKVDFLSLPNRRHGCSGRTSSWTWRDSVPELNQIRWRFKNTNRQTTRWHFVIKNRHFINMLKLESLENTIAFANFICLIAKRGKKIVHFIYKNKFVSIIA